MILNKSEKLHINLDNICELNHFVHTHSLITQSVGKEYNALFFYKKEENTDADPWLYTVNKHGYRGNNWSMRNDSIAFFGCSITFGIGVEHNIASVIQQNINKECINIGQPGASALTILKTFFTFIKHYPIDTAVITLPSLLRVYYPTYNVYKNTERWNYESLLPSWISDSQKDIHKTAFKFFNEDTSSAYLYDYIQMAETMASISNTKIIWSSWDADTLKFLKSIVDKQKIIPVANLSADVARDNLHPGPIFVKNWADIIVNKL
jgi:hypothetical protein